MLKLFQPIKADS